MKLELDRNEQVALTSALENYLDGIGIGRNDEDENVLEKILATLAG